MTTISLVVVSYHSSGVLAEALASFRVAASEAHQAAEVIVVDHSGDAEEHQRLKSLEPDQLLTRENRGFAAGINAGVQAAGGQYLALANPDITLHPKALSLLLDALEAGWEIVGPRFELGGADFPASEAQTPWAELRRLAACRSPENLRRHLRREARLACRLWASSTIQPAAALSGAFLVTRRQTLEKVGPWDESYFLYFEESDWLRRAQQRGCPLGWVPGARVTHAWGHAAHPGEQQQVFERSREKYFGEHYPRWTRPAPEPMPPPGWPHFVGPPEASVREAAQWFVSPSPWGFPAASLGLLQPDGVRPALDRFAAARSHEGPLVVWAYVEARDQLLGIWGAGTV